MQADHLVGREKLRLNDANYGTRLMPLAGLEQFKNNSLCEPSR